MWIQISFNSFQTRSYKTKTVQYKVLSVTLTYDTVLSNGYNKILITLQSLLSFINRMLLSKAEHIKEKNVGLYWSLRAVFSRTECSNSCKRFMRMSAGFVLRQHTYSSLTLTDLRVKHIINQHWSMDWFWEIFFVTLFYIFIYM